MAWLAVKAGPQQGRSYELTGRDATIGRDSGCDIAIDDRGVSRYHARLCFGDGQFLFLDAGSRGGTRVNGQPVEGRTLRPGGTLRVGETVLTLVPVEAQDPQYGSHGTETMVGSPTGPSGLLVVQSGPDAGRSFPLSEGQNILGRDLSCAIQLGDDTVSQRHCALRLEGDTVSAYDLGSSNGTWVDGQAVTGRTLASGDVIALGSTEMQFVRVA